MQEFSNFYEKCTALSKKGDEKALQELLRLSIGGNKTARIALRKTRNKKLLKTLLDEKINNALNIVEKSGLLALAVRVFRKEYLYLYLMDTFQNKKDLGEAGFFKNVRGTPLDDQEQEQLKKYVIDAQDFDIRLINLIDIKEREDILYELLSVSIEEGVDTRTARIFQANKDYLQLIQPELRKAIKNRVDGTSTFATYLDLNHEENQKCIADFKKFSLIYVAVKNNIWDYRKINIFNKKISIAFKLCRNDELDSSDWTVIKKNIEKELLGIHDGQNATKMLFDLLSVLSIHDYSYAENVLIEICNRTSLYSTKALEVLGELHSEYAYKEFLKKIITAQQETECFHTCVKLIGYFPEREKAIVEYVKILDDKRLIDVIHAKATKILADRGEQMEEPHVKISFSGKNCVVLDNNTILNELLVNLGEQINANQLYVAVGFSFESGLRLVKPLLEQIRNNSGKIELVIGALQTYGTGRKNTKIDRNSVVLLNDLKKEYSLKLYTYQESFYHGKFYYVGNDNKGYVIVGSSNISKTAYFNNYELNLLFEVDRNNPEDQEFLGWFEKFRAECAEITELDPEQFEKLQWDSELDIYESTKIVKISHDDVRSRISELSDEETKFRLNTWLEHEPTEIYSNLEIPSLQEYIVFLYPGNELAVFESFIPGNAYYAFKYTEFEKLVNQVSALTKTQMLMNSAFLNRGYHLQDSVKTKEKINMLFTR